jgi:hypothetical protein
MSRPHSLALFSRWQVMDALGKAAAPLGIFAVIGGLPMWLTIKEHGLAGADGQGGLRTLLLQQYTNGLVIALALGAIILMSGGSSLDRERQHVRFLFSRPVAPWQLYLQQYLVATLLFTAAIAIIPLLTNWLLFDVEVVGVVYSALIFAFVYGSLGFLCGAITNRDGIPFIGVMVVTQVLQGAQRAGALGTTLGYVAKSLPPLAAAGGIRADLFAGRPVTMSDLWLVLGYSSAMLVTALIIVRQRPLVR